MSLILFFLVLYFLYYFSIPINVFMNRKYAKKAMIGRKYLSILKKYSVAFSDYKFYYDVENLFYVEDLLYKCGFFEIVEFDEGCFLINFEVAER